MRRSTFAAFWMILGAFASGCSGDPADPASVTELDAQAEDATASAEDANITVDTQVVRIPGEAPAN